MTKILVVDDTPDARDFISSILILKRFEVVMAADGIEGLQQARSELPDLIITDLTMPRLPGIEMIQKLRAMTEFRDIPILAVTSHGRERAVEALKAGANRALSRPEENHLLLDSVFELLNGKA
jgi:CheY-like chemotaxis protein